MNIYEPVVGNGLLSARTEKCYQKSVKIRLYIVGLYPYIVFHKKQQPIMFEIPTDC